MSVSKETSPLQYELFPRGKSFADLVADHYERHLGLLDLEVSYLEYRRDKFARHNRGAPRKAALPTIEVRLGAFKSDPIES
jgi:hypothetical protein